VFFERTGAAAVGKLHLANNSTADASNAVLADAKLTIDSAGLVGIGTTSPSAKLDVNGLAQFLKGSSNGITIGDVSTNSNSVLRMQGTSAGYNWQIANNLNVAGLEFTPSTATGGTTYTTPAMALTTTGLGIGTSSPAVKLDVAGSATLGSATTDITNVSGYMGVGTAGLSSRSINLGSSALTGTTQFGIVSGIISTSSATTATVGYYSGVSTAASAYTSGAVRGFWADDCVKGAGSTITNQHGVYIGNQTQGTNNYGITSLVSSGTNKWNIYASGTADNYFAGNVGLGTATPAYKLEINGSARISSKLLLDTGTSALPSLTFFGWVDTGIYNPTGTSIAFSTVGAERMRLDNSGNLGLGVTPSAWASGYNAIQFGSGSSRAGALFTNGANDVWQTSNAYFNGTNFIYFATSTATAYNQSSGTHNWRIAASGTAGNAITFTQAMTLDASGRLLIGTTSTYDFNGQANLVVAGTSNNATITVASTTDGYIVFADGTSGTDRYAGMINYNHTSNYMVFRTAATEQARIDSSGNLLVGTTATAVAKMTIVSTTNPALTLPNIAEIATISATAATGTINYDLTTQSVLYYTTSASANFTMNVRGNSGLTLNSMLAIGQSVTMAFLCTTGATAYYQSAMTIDGTSVTPKWQGGTAPTSGNASSIDVYSYTIIKTAASTYTVLASQTKFA
jgi:hypothetical protein